MLTQDMVWFASKYVWVRCHFLLIYLGNSVWSASTIWRLFLKHFNPLPKNLVLDYISQRNCHFFIYNYLPTAKFPDGGLVRGLVFGLVDGMIVDKMDMRLVGNLVVGFLEELVVRVVGLSVSGACVRRRIVVGVCVLRSVVGAGGCVGWDVGLVGHPGKQLVQGWVLVIYFILSMYQFQT